MGHDEGQEIKKTDKFYLEERLIDKFYLGENGSEFVRTIALGPSHRLSALCRSQSQLNKRLMEKGLF